ncbi:Carbohydrate-selective porin [Roseibium album]|nr:Carbohydrate-selective porin [Roseibium album]
MPFLRGGWSDGNATLVDANVAVGFGLKPFEDEADLFGLALGWARPSIDSLEQQYTLEAFYRFHLTDNLAITPDAQLIINPALTPAEEALWTGDLRVRSTF